MIDKHLKVTPPSQYHTSLWKNGKGKTTELAINDNGTLDNFSFRLSIATVSEDGLFSNFNGLERNLFLLSGNGIELSHQSNTTGNGEDKTIDKLTKKLDYATFNGGSTTFGRLLDGGITDFNVIHNAQKHSVDIITTEQVSAVDIKAADRCFIYPTKTAVTLFNLTDNSERQISAQHLLCLNKIKHQQFRIKGEQMIIIHFTDIN